MFEGMKSMNDIKKEERPFYRKKRFLWGGIAALLALAVLLTGLVMIFTAAPTVYSFGGARLREDVYSYWFSCYKYVYQVNYRDLDIEDSEAGWAQPYRDGMSYEELFRERIDERIRLRFIAASLFDSQGYTLSESDREALDALMEELETESFGEVPLDVLEKTYGIGKNAVKQAALYEQKYEALYKQLFSDASVIYSDAYRDALKSFYETYYLRYNCILIKDDAGDAQISALEAALFPADGARVTEETFTALEAEYTDENFKVTSGNYPNGIYLYAGESYARSFDAELLSAFSEAAGSDGIGKIVKKRNAEDNGTYYVMRYALDDAPYLLDEKWVDVCFGDLPSYAGIAFYHDLLREELASLKTHEAHANHSVANAVSCKYYNIVQLLGND